MFKKNIDTITDSLRVKNNEIIGNIYNLEKKLNGEIPVTRLELLVLVSSWGRTSIFYTNIKDDKVLIKEKNKGKSFDLSKLDTSEITDMSSIFRHSNFNGDISNWNTSKVTNMKDMFSFAREFNSNIGNWNTSKVTDMSWMFYSSENFNKDIGKWNTSNVTDMKGIFYQACNFNQNINNWNTSKVIDLSWAFLFAEKFNQPLNNWDTSNLLYLESTFKGAVSFNQPLNNWNTSKVMDMRYTFERAVKFNQPLDNWDVSNVISMKSMFSDTKDFNQDINSWNISKVTSLYGIFDNTISFDQPFNLDISHVKNIESIFLNAKAFLDKYNNGEHLSLYRNDFLNWLKDNQNRMNEIHEDSLNVKIKNNEESFEEIIKEKNIPIESSLYKDMYKIFNETQHRANKPSIRMQQAIHCL